MTTERPLPSRVLSNGVTLCLVAPLPAVAQDGPELSRDLIAGSRGREFAELLAAEVWRLTGAVLGSAHQDAAFAAAEQFLTRGADAYREGRPRTWAAVIVWMIAEDRVLVEHPDRTPKSLAYELDVGLVTIRRRLPIVRRVLGTSGWAPRRARP